MRPLSKSYSRIPRHRLDPTILDVERYHQGTCGGDRSSRFGWLGEGRGCLSKYWSKWSQLGMKLASEQEPEHSGRVQGEIHTNLRRCPPAHRRGSCRDHCKPEASDRPRRPVNYIKHQLRTAIAAHSRCSFPAASNRKAAWRRKCNSRGRLGTFGFRHLHRSAWQLGALLGERST